jgi:hypothetical protein
MAFHSLMMRLAAQLRSAIPAPADVVELGNQTFKARPGDCERVAAWLSHRSLPFDAGLLRDIDARVDAARDASTSDYYRALGYSSYHAIDVNGRYDSLVMDLNRNLVEHYGFRSTFDLVTNNGTGEHVFDQAAVFSNAHALCRVGGSMLHVLPFFNYLNHGFFAFNPVLFHDLAAANGYGLARLSIASNHGAEIGTDADGDRVLSRDELQERCAVDGSRRGSLQHLLGLGKRGKRGRRALSNALRHVMRDGPNVSVVAVLRKSVDAPFEIPIQGMYGGANIDDVDVRHRYTADARRSGAAS